MTCESIGPICYFNLHNMEEFDDSVEIKLKLLLNSAIQFYIVVLICQSDSCKMTLFNFGCFVNTLTILLQNFPLRFLIEPKL